MADNDGDSGGGNGEHGRLRPTGPIDTLRAFLASETAGGALLVLSAAVALVLANSPQSAAYDAFFEVPVTVTVADFGVDKPLLLWINDGLMAWFFLLVGLEIKREFLEGELSTRDQAALPGLCAVGGFLAPAAIYLLINQDDPGALHGWAIPSATDIAFALGVLALLGDRIPLSLKVFVTALAIVDDILAILVIALYYSGDLGLYVLAGAGLTVGVLVLMNYLNVTHIAPYVVLGGVIWVLVLKSGMHATIAGVAVAFTIPLKARNRHGESPARIFEDALRPWATFLILPAFALANAGVSFEGLTLGKMIEPVPLGIILGLVLGKQLGVFGTAWAAIRLGWVRRPAGTTWLMLYGASLVTGIGFTMSLFIGTLARAQGAFQNPAAIRLGVLAGSAVSAVAGYLVLRYATSRAAAED